MGSTNPVTGFFAQKNIFVVLTYKCNAFCKKCITRYNRFRDQSMREDDCQRLAKWFVENHYSGTINMGSGESLLYEGLPDFVENILSGLPAVSFRILSNGKVFTPRLPAVLFSPRINWGITLDGFNNADISNLQQGINLEIVKDNIISVCNAGFADNLYVNYTLNNQNIGSLKAYIDFAKSLRIPDLYVTEMKVYRGFANLERYRLSPKSREFALQMKEYAETLSFRKIGFDVDRDKTIPKRCFQRKHCISPIIDLDCTLAFCYGQEDAFVGNIFDPSTIEKWDRMFEKFNSDELASEKWCSRCFSKIDKNGCFSVPLSLNPYLQEKCGE